MVHRDRHLHRGRADDEPGGGARGDHPDRPRLGIPPHLVAFSTACIGIYFFPANGSRSPIATDETGTTGISKYAIWHSFSLPMFVMWLSSTVVASLVAVVVYGTS